MGFHEQGTKTGTQVYCNPYKMDSLLNVGLFTADVHFWSNVISFGSNKTCSYLLDEALIAWQA